MFNALVAPENPDQLAHPGYHGPPDSLEEEPGRSLLLISELDREGLVQAILVGTGCRHGEPPCAPAALPTVAQILRIHIGRNTENGTYPAQPDDGVDSPGPGAILNL